MCSLRLFDERLQKAIDLAPLTAHVPKQGNLFGLPCLSSVNDLHFRNKETISKCDAWVAELVSYSQGKTPTCEVVAVLDNMSNALCVNMDTTNCLRMIHPSNEWREAALESHTHMIEYMEGLNTNLGVYNALVKYMAQPNFKNLSADEIRNANQLLLDFQHSGLHLDDAGRRKLVQLTQQSFVLGAQLEEAMAKREIPVTLRGGKVTQVPVHSLLSAIIQSSDRGHRALLSKISNMSTDDNVDSLLLEMLASRLQLAKLAGWNSHADKVLRLAMIKTPENVKKFFDAFAKNIEPSTVLEKAALKQQVELDEKKEVRDVAYHDLNYYQSTHRRTAGAGVQEYFGLGVCVAGFSQLATSVFGVSLVPVAALAGELCHSSIVKTNVVDQSGRMLGTLYLDLYAREGKSNAPCVYNIMSGCDGAHLSSPQLPVALLSCSLSQSRTTGPRLLAFQEYSTLFHELGHALHAMCGTTRFQNTSGLRCSTDFAELPSILMEFFCQDYRVVSKFARHYKTNKMIGEADFAELMSSKLSYPFLEAESTLILSRIDQEFHGAGPYKTKEQLHQAVHACTRHCALENYPSNVAYQGFRHLSTYGASYYSYMWCRALAGLLWSSAFKEDPWCNVSGARYRREILAMGNSRDPWLSLAAFLGHTPDIDAIAREGSRHLNE